MSNTVFFREGQLEEMGVFLATLVKQGITWNCQEGITGWTITLTGF